ncbi:MAG TPA: hypothetical protein VN735_04315 [Steroidobacteraceae bacterium]|nr:hypothetical protein [Steroidobacteraceae bacterium]
MTLLATDDRNADQVAYWNGASGEARYQVGSAVALPGAIWIVSATNP